MTRTPSSARRKAWRLGAGLLCAAMVTLAGASACNNDGTTTDAANCNDFSVTWDKAAWASHAQNGGTTGSPQITVVVQTQAEAAASAKPEPHTPRPTALAPAQLVLTATPAAKVRLVRYLPYTSLHSGKPTPGQPVTLKLKKGQPFSEPLANNVVRVKLDGCAT